MADYDSAVFQQTDRNRVRRGHIRASYDKDVVYSILDSHFLCHISYEMNGQPFVVPTSFWREGNKLYWHGSSKSQMIRHLAKGNPVALCVTHLDGLVLARSAFSTSVNYRSVICYGQPKLVKAKAEWVRQMKLFFDRLAPGRWAELRPMTDQEYKATALLEMEIDDASAKVRRAPPGDAEEADWPIWAGVIPLFMQQGSPEKAPEKGSYSLNHPVMPDFEWATTQK